MFGIGKKKEDKDVSPATVATTTENVPVTLDTSTNKVEIDPDITATTDATIATIDKIVEGDEPDEPAPLTYKEAKAFKKSKYGEKIANNDKFTKIYIIRNKRTNQVVELRAASPIHACNIIGWKPRKVQVLDVKTIEKPLDEPETAASSTDSETTAVIESKSE